MRRKIVTSYDHGGPHWHQLPALAESLCRSSDAQRIDESDEEFCQRIAAEIGAEFVAQAGAATGAENFVFSVFLR